MSDNLNKVEEILESVAIKSANQCGGFVGWETPEERAEVIEKANQVLTTLIDEEVEKALKEYQNHVGT